MIGPKRGTAAWKRLTKTVYYGIDPKTFEVKRISLTNDNLLHYYGEHGSYDHAVLRGRMPRNEVAIVWHLSDIIEVPAGFEDDDFEKRKVQDLRAKADSKKKAAEADKGA